VSAPPAVSTCAIELRHQALVTEGYSDVRWSLRDAPAGMSISADSGELSWTPPTPPSEPVAFTVVAASAGLEATQPVQIAVDCPALKVACGCGSSEGSGVPLLFLVAAGLWRARGSPTQPRQANPR
jgi:hypothetical protein